MALLTDKVTKQNEIKGFAELKLLTWLSSLGEMFYADGSKYIGQWAKGCYHGEGRYYVVKVGFTSFSFVIQLTVDIDFI